MPTSEEAGRGKTEDIGDVSCEQLGAGQAGPAAEDSGEKELDLENAGVLVRFLCDGEDDSDVLCCRVSSFPAAVS